MLKGGGGDPYVIGGNGRSGFFQLIEHGTVEFGRAFIDGKKENPWRVQELGEFLPIGRFAGTGTKARIEFPDGNRRNSDHARLP